MFAKPAARLAKPKERPQHISVIVETLRSQFERTQKVSHILRREVANLDVERPGKATQPIGDVSQVNRAASHALLGLLKVLHGVGEQSASDPPAMVKHVEVGRVSEAVPRLKHLGRL